LMKKKAIEAIYRRTNPQTIHLSLADPCSDQPGHLCVKLARVGNIIDSAVARTGDLYGTIR
jgi:hypothetical protein